MSQLPTQLAGSPPRQSRRLKAGELSGETGEQLVPAEEVAPVAEKDSSSPAGTVSAADKAILSEASKSGTPHPRPRGTKLPG